MPYLDARSAKDTKNAKDAKGGSIRRPSIDSLGTVARRGAPQ
jgi:hypothetical protein